MISAVAAVAIGVGGVGSFPPDDPATMAVYLPCAAGGPSAADNTLAQRLNGVLTKNLRGAMNGQRTACARAIVQEVRAEGLSERAAVIALSTAIVESTLLNNATEEDHDSLGLFQQRASWGSRANRLNPAWATRAFLAKMQRLYPNGTWQTAEIGKVCQDVQVSAFPNKYAVEVSDAALIADALWGEARDVTGDGKGDLVVQTKQQNGNGSLYVYLGGNGDGFWGTVLVPYANSPANGRNKIAVSDINGDGVDDIIIARPSAANPNTTTIHMLKGGTVRNGIGVGTAIREFGEPVENIELAGGNITGGSEGDLAIQVKEQNGNGTLYIFQGGNGDGFSGKVLAPYGNSPANGRNKITVSNINGDGFSDLIVASPHTTKPVTTTFHLLKGGTLRTGGGPGPILREFGEPVEHIDLP